MQPPARPRSVVIVGGGTAGWMSAALLSRTWGEGGGASITVIESPQVGRVGVGESSLPPLRRLLGRLGIEEAEWMARCDATYKCALHLVGWNGRAGPRDYYHPLFRWGEDRQELFHEWLEARTRDGFTAPFASACFAGVHLARAGRAPRLEPGPIMFGPMQYAYHIDAALLADYLKEWCRRRGVRGLVGNVTEVRRDAHGAISGLETRECGPLRADLYLDCTGFLGLLVNKALKEPFVPYADHLFCDSAIAISTFTDASEGRVPSETRATALSAGWCWDIPLRHRHGTGYVYSSGHLPAGAAERELRRHLGGGVRQGEARHIRMRVGRTRRTWVHNCVSVGLSAGFIEPLESTSIFCIQYGIAELLRCMHGGGSDTARRRRYNRRMKTLFDGLRDFVMLHYRLNRREDSEFWIANRENPNLPAPLAEILERWGRGQDIEELLASHGSASLVQPASWYCIFAGLDCLPAEMATGRPRSGPAGARLRARLRSLREEARGYPDHRAFLARLDAPLPAAV